MTIDLDALDQLAADAFDGYVVRKGLARRFKGQYPVPTYVGEILLGRYCASTDEAEIAEGLGIVETQMTTRTVRAGQAVQRPAPERQAKLLGRGKLVAITMPICSGE